MRNRKDGSVRVSSDASPTVAQILDVEEWAMQQLNVTQQDSLWAVQMAITFRVFGFYPEAIERATISQKLDPEDWRAPFCLAQTYALQGDYTLAIQTLSRVIEAFRASQVLMEKWRDTFYDSILYFLGEWHSELHEFEAAMAAFREIYEHNSDKYESALKIILLLQDQEKYSDIMGYLQEMNQRMNDEGLSRLIAMSHEYSNYPAYHQTITKAAKLSNGFKVIREAYQLALEAAEKDTSRLAILAGLRYWYGLTLFYDRETEADLKEAMSMWEKTITLSRPGGSSDEQFIRMMTAEKLASVYLELAREAGVDSPEGQDYLKKMAYLCNNGGDEESDMTDARTPLLLSRLYRLIGNEEQAKESLRSHVKLSIDLLSDEDDGNDWQGYERLAMAFLHFNDDINALAAWSLLGPVEEEDGEENQEEEQENTAEADGDAEPGSTEDHIQTDALVADKADLEGIEQLRLVDEAEGTPNDEKLNGNSNVSTDNIGDQDAAASTRITSPTTKGAVHSSAPESQGDSPASPQPETSGDPAPETAHRYGNTNFSCDGRCGHIWTFADDIYACRDCVDVQFEAGCLEKLQNGTLERKVCGKTHEFFHIPKWNDEEARQIPRGSVKVGGEIISIATWLDSIRKEWGFMGTGVAADGVAE
jgi:tetratricopeptide (TPR) repeat protein